MHGKNVPARQATCRTTAAGGPPPGFRRQASQNPPLDAAQASQNLAMSQILASSSARMPKAGRRQAGRGRRQAGAAPEAGRRREAKIRVFSKSLQGSPGGPGDPPGAAGGCRELPGASGGFREPPGPISGSGKVPEKIKSGLNRHFCQQLAAILIPRAPVVPPGLWTRKN